MGIKLSMELDWWGYDEMRVKDMDRLYNAVMDMCPEDFWVKELKIECSSQLPSLKEGACDFPQRELQ